MKSRGIIIFVKENESATLNVKSENNYGPITINIKICNFCPKVGDNVEFNLHEVTDFRTKTKTKTYSILNLKLLRTSNMNIHKNKVPVKSYDEMQLNKVMHLYMPWNPGYIPDQMYQLKDRIARKNYTWVPKLNKTTGKDSIGNELYEIVSKQLDLGYFR